MTKLILPIFGQPGPNELAEIHLVGRYALGATWADKHGSIYPFERLRRDCQRPGGVRPPIRPLGAAGHDGRRVPCGARRRRGGGSRG